MIKKRHGRPRKHYKDEEYEALARQNVLAYWCLATPIILDGYPFMFTDHEYLLDVYLSDDKQIEVYKKAAQTGFTVRALLGSIFKCKHVYPSGVLYLFPTRGDVTEFSKTRFTRLQRDNPTLQSWVHDTTDSVSIKGIGNGFFYFRGMRTREALKSIPVDCVVFDEYDEHIVLPNETTSVYTSPNLALERLSHSRFKQQIYLSTPTLPDFGIDLVYETSDQKHWFIKCFVCNTWTCLEYEFVESEGDEQKVLIKTKGDEVIRACKKCRSEIDPKNGQWVASKVGKGLPSGWWISQLCSKLVSPLSLLEEYEIHVLRTRPVKVGKANPQEFWNSKIGRAWVSATARLTKEQIRKCCGQHDLQTYSEGSCVMGVDQASNLHVVIISYQTGKLVISFLGILQEWEQLKYYMKAFHVQCCVVDALPETRNARSFANLFPGKVFLNYYIDSRKGSYSWNEEEYIVQVNRTETLDETHEKIVNKELVLPKDGINETEIFISHCHNIAKRLVEDPRTGGQKYVYVKLGEDHFRHSLNYASIALTRVMGGGDIDDMEVGASLISANPDWD